MGIIPTLILAQAAAVQYLISMNLSQNQLGLAWTFYVTTLVTMLLCLHTFLAALVKRSHDLTGIDWKPYEDLIYYTKLGSILVITSIAIRIAGIIIPTPYPGAYDAEFGDPSLIRLTIDMLSIFLSASLHQIASIIFFSGTLLLVLMPLVLLVQLARTPGHPGPNKHGSPTNAPAPKKRN